jgi:hypothetical protein
LAGKFHFWVRYRLQLPLLTKLQRYPPDNEEKQKQLGAWFGKNPPGGVAERLPGLVKALEAKYPSIKSWGVLGVRARIYFPGSVKEKRLIKRATVLLGWQGRFARHVG